MCTSFIIYVLKIFWSHCGGMWDLSSPTRDQTHAPCIRSMKSLTPGLPGKSLNLLFFLFFFNKNCRWFWCVSKCGGHLPWGQESRWTSVLECLWFFPAPYLPPMHTSFRRALSARTQLVREGAQPVLSTWFISLFPFLITATLSRYR